MTFRSKHFAATAGLAAGLAIAAIASANTALAQPVSTPSVAQPTAVAPVTAPATPAYPDAAGTVQPQPYTAGPPPMMGAVAGTTAADRDGDGIVDGYYTSDGFYHPYVAPTPAPAPRYLSRRGERG